MNGQLCNQLKYVQRRCKNVESTDYLLRVTLITIPFSRYLATIEVFLVVTTRNVCIGGWAPSQRRIEILLTIIQLTGQPPIIIYHQGWDWEAGISSATNYSRNWRESTMGDICFACSWPGFIPQSPSSPEHRARSMPGVSVPKTKTFFFSRTDDTKGQTLKLVTENFIQEIMIGVKGRRILNRSHNYKCNSLRHSTCGQHQIGRTVSIKAWELHRS